MNLTWSFMKVRLHCCIEEGKWAIYAAQEVNPWEAHVRDFMNKPNVPPARNAYEQLEQIQQMLHSLPPPNFRWLVGSKEHNKERSLI